MRGLIAVVLVIGAGLGWLVRQAHIQRDAVAAIEEAGGEAYYDWEWEWNNGKGIPEGKLRAQGGSSVLLESIISITSPLSCLTTQPIRRSHRSGVSVS